MGEDNTTGLQFIEQGTALYRKVNWALFFGAFVIFANLYDVQPLLPKLTTHFHLHPAVASIALSISTLVMAFGLLVAGALSETYGRRPIMLVSLVAVSATSIASTFAQNFAWFLVLRAIQGIAFSGLPAVAMAYLSEEIHPKHLGSAMGLYISGNSVGGMAGRIVSALFAALSWRFSIFVIGLVGTVMTIWFWRALPESRNFKPQPLQLSSLFRRFGNHLRDPGLLLLFSLGFVLMGGFVTFYNYMPFRLASAPYHLPQAVIAWLFLVYIVGTWSSSWMGKLADKYGRRRILWLAISIYAAGDLLSVLHPILTQVVGIALLTFGFFGAHALASSWVGRRATRDKAQASSLYLFFYYMGSSIGGTIGGVFYGLYGWYGIAGFVAVFFIWGAIATWVLSRIPNVKGN